MKLYITSLLSLTLTLSSYGQKEFIGIAKYKMAVVGGADADSMTIIFNKNKVLIKLYIPSHQNPTIVNEIRIISDFLTNKKYTINNIAKTYKVDTLLNIIGYDFIDTKQMALVKGAVCFQYKGDSSKIDKSKMQRADCLASIDYTNKTIGNFWFMGFQPIIVDNKIVMDFIVTEPDGSKPRVYISDIIAEQNVDEYFDLSKYSVRK